MTLEAFKEIEDNIKAIVSETLDAVKDKSFEDYCLLLARAGYQVELEGSTLSPYVIDSRLENHQDRTRQRFLLDYLNQYYRWLKDGVVFTPKNEEFNLNIQMMIYAQIWESHFFLKTLKRIADILAGKPYVWQIKFANPAKSNPEKDKPISRSKFINEQILSPLSRTKPPIYGVIEEAYDSDLRNAFAHSSYYIDMEGKVIASLNSERYSIDKEIHFCKWEKMFVQSVMLSYYISVQLQKRVATFLDDNPDKKEVKVDWPSFIRPGNKRQIIIKPEKTPYGVEFSFKHNP